MVANGIPGESTASGQSRIFISYKRDAEPDSSLASFLYDSLAGQGQSVFIDVEIPPGSDWSELISTEIRSSDFFVVLLTEASAAPQGFVVAETVMAKDSEAATGHPKILPVRLAYTKNLPLRLSAAIGHLQHFEWRNPTDNDALLVTLLQAIGKHEGSDAERYVAPAGRPLHRDRQHVAIGGDARVSGGHDDRACDSRSRRQTSP